MQYQQKLDDIERKFEDLNRQMADPAVISDSAQYRKVSKAQSELSEIVSKYREWKTASRNLEEARADADGIRSRIARHGARRKWRDWSRRSHASKTS